MPQVLALPTVRVLLAGKLLTALAGGLLQAVFSLMLQQGHGLNPAQNGAVLSYVGVATVVCQAVLVGPVTRRVRPHAAGLACVALMAVGYLAIGERGAGTWNHALCCTRAGVYQNEHPGYLLLLTGWPLHQCLFFSLMMALYAGFEVKCLRESCPGLTPTACMCLAAGAAHQLPVLMLALLPVCAGGVIVATLNTAQLTQAVPPSVTGSVLALDMAAGSGVRMATPGIGTYLLSVGGPAAVGGAAAGLMGLLLVADMLGLASAALDGVGASSRAVPSQGSEGSGEQGAQSKEGEADKKIQ